MNFIEAVKTIEKDCYGHMHKKDGFDKRVEIINGVLCYVEERFWDVWDGMEYIPTTQDMLTEEWFVNSSQVVDGVPLSEFEGEKIMNLEYPDNNSFVLTLCNGKKYVFDTENYDTKVNIKEISNE